MALHAFCGPKTIHVIQKMWLTIAEGMEIPIPCLWMASAHGTHIHISYDFDMSTKILYIYLVFI